MKLSKKLTIIFALIIIVFAGLLITFDGLFLDLYYAHRTKNNIKEVYYEAYEYVINNENTGMDYIGGLNSIGEKYGINICVFDINGSNTDLYRKDRIPNINSLINVNNLTSDILVEEINIGLRDEKSIIGAGKLIKDGNFIGYIMIYSPITIIKENTSIFRTFVLYISVGLILLTVVLALIVSERLTKPIKDAEIKTKKMAELDFSTKLDVISNDEIGSLSVSINKMSDELEKSIEDLKKANKKLEDDIKFKERVSKLREEFISDVSHELKTPISIINGYSEALKLEGLTKEDIESYTDIIMDESKRMDKLVRDLLKFTQIDSGFIDLDKEDIKIKDLIDGVVKPLELKLKEKQINIYINVDDIIINGDYDMLTTVFNNFLTNAINYVSGERIIEITGSIVKDKYRIKVYNSGSSISEENISRIWDSFYKADKARSRSYGGSGLGLAICKSIMETYKNEYGVVNEKDGVTFFFDMNIGGI